jgi:hypothetical protein
MDCLPLGSTSCNFSPSSRPSIENSHTKTQSEPEYGFYCYNPWAYYMAMSNHLRVNNDTAFLRSRAANSSQSVEQALEGVTSVAAGSAS